MKIAILQMNSLAGDVLANIRKIESAAIEATKNEAKILICPELALTGYGAGDALHQHANAATNKGLQSICDISKQNNIAIITGYSEKTASGFANSACFIADGKLESNYRKCQLWADYEARYFEAAPPSAIITDYRGLRIGMLICYDVEFPERVRLLAMKGVDLIAVPTATAHGYAASFIAEKMISVRAFENQTFIAYANHNGSDGRFHYAGLSCVAAPDGRLMVQAKANEDALIYADIKPEHYEDFCKETPYLRDLVIG